MPPDDLTGQLLHVTAERVAHGGHVVARHEGRVVFVRHALPGEQVVCQVTAGDSGDRFLRADAVTILEASPHRVEPPCRYAGPGGCGGCDWQHAALAYQRELKAEVVGEQLRRLGGVTGPAGQVTVRPVPGDADGVRWRTRMDFAVDADGRAGLRRHRDNAVVPLTDCLIAHPAIAESGIFERRFQGARALRAIVTGDGVRVRPDPALDAEPVPAVVERVRWPGGEATFEVAEDGFWQVHPGAPTTFVAEVLDRLRPRPGERVLDLYAGAGLFTVPLADAVGESGKVVAVEGDATAVRHGERNTVGHPQVSWVRGDVARVLRTPPRPGRSSGGRSGRRPPPVPGRADLVVLDPPRKGAGAQVVAQVVARHPRLLAYIACDPASLGRDVRTFAGAGYRLVSAVAFDAFPMTHHVETIAVFGPATGS